MSIVVPGPFVKLRISFSMIMSILICVYGVVNVRSIARCCFLREAALLATLVTHEHYCRLYYLCISLYVCTCITIRMTTCRALS